MATQSHPLYKTCKCTKEKDWVCGVIKYTWVNQAWLSL